MKPIRLQLSRAKGFRLQEHSRAVNGLPAVKVDRSTRFGNPCGCQAPYGCPHSPEFEHYAYASDDGSVPPLTCCVDVFRHYVKTGIAGQPTQTGRLWIAADGLAGYPRRQKLVENLASLRGLNLACWCKLEARCHADVLLELANQPVCDDPDSATPTGASFETPRA